jgi:hypothetical protein
MIHLITGRPGHGKNIYALTFLEKEGFINYDKESKTFSSTIDRPLFFIAFDSINIVDATTAKYEDLDKLPEDQESENRSKFPDNSVIVIDEAHRYSPRSSNRSGFTGFVSFLKIHRHFGFDFIFITQSQKDLNIDIRNLVENHFRVNRPFGTQKSFVNHYLGAETSENKQPVKQSSKPFVLDKRFFEVYKSASIHNYKSSIPKKYYAFIVLFIIFIGFVISKGIYVIDAFSSGDALNFGKELQSELVPDKQPTLSNEQRRERSANRLQKPYFYIFKNQKKFENQGVILSTIAPNIVMNKTSIFCYCNKQQIEILDNLMRLIDTSNNIKIDFILVSFSKKDYMDFSLKYTFQNDYFSISPSAALIPNLLLLDYLKTDYKTLTKINSTALVEVGESFSSNFVTKYPVILKDYKSSSVSSVRLKSDNLVKSTATSKQQPSDRVVGEKISYNNVGFEFKVATQYVDDQTIIVNLKQSHSFLQGFVNDVPVTDKRDFKTQFLLKSGQLVPLFNLSTLLNSRSKKETIPFLSYFLPGKVDDDNSSYQVFLRFNFEFDKAKLKSKPKTIKAIKPILEIKEIEEAKETSNIEQTIDELLAADIEALEELNQEVDQELSDEIKVLDVKLEVVDIENIKQPK